MSLHLFVHPDDEQIVRWATSDSEDVTFRIGKHGMGPEPGEVWRWDLSLTTWENGCIPHPGAWSKGHRLGRDNSPMDLGCSYAKAKADPDRVRRYKDRQRRRSEIRAVVGRT